MAPVISRFVAPALVPLVALALLPAPALAEEGGAAKDGKAKAAELVPVGEPVSCIMPSQLRSTRVIDDQTIDFEMNNGTVYRNRLSHRCPGLKMEERFAYKISTSQLCSVDIITVLQSFGGGLSQGASCGLGTFQKMEKPGQKMEKPGK